MFKKNTYISLTENSSKKPEVPEGLLKKCNACKSAIFAQTISVRNVTIIFGSMHVIELRWLRMKEVLKNGIPIW